MEIIIYFSIVVALIAFKLAWDWYNKNKKGRIINHSRSVLIDGIFYLLSSLVLFYENGIITMLGYIVIAADLRWMLFDSAFGLLNGNGIDWHGKSSKIDLFLIRVGRYHFLIKLIPITIGLALIYNKEVWQVILNLVRALVGI